jgi:hypothetical protein
MEGSRASRDALVVADPPGSVLAAGGPGVWVERGVGDPYRWLEAKLPGWETSRTWSTRPFARAKAEIPTRPDWS